MAGEAVYGVILCGDGFGGICERARENPLVRLASERAGEMLVRDG